MIYVMLFYEFFKVGLFAVGGGMATIPFLMELPSKYDWYTTSELADMIAVSESTPGPIGVNMATFAGYHAAGIPGALVATLALVAPAVIIITIIARFLAGFGDNKTVKSAFYGLRPTVAALIGYAVYELVRITLFSVDASGFSPNYPGIAVCIFVFALLQVKKLEKIHPLIWLIAGAGAGILLKL